MEEKKESGMTVREYAELLKEIHEGEEMIDKANEKLARNLAIVGILIILFMIGHYNGWFC